MKDYKETAFKTITYVTALSTIAILMAIIYSLFREGLPLFESVPRKTFYVAVPGILRMVNQNSEHGL